VIDALEELLSRSGKLDLARIERIEVNAYGLAAMLAEKRVTSSFGARFSVPFALATILYHGRSELAAFEQAAVDNATIQALAARALPGRAGLRPAHRPVRRTGPRRALHHHQGRAFKAASARRAASEIHAARGADLGRARRPAPDFSRFAEGFDL
jgi:2-methylcitrate dehydratase PrpD